MGPWVLLSISSSCFHIVFSRFSPLPTLFPFTLSPWCAAFPCTGFFSSLSLTLIVLSFSVSHFWCNPWPVLIHYLY